MKFLTRFFLLFIFLSCSFLLSRAQFSVNGKITDNATGKTLGFTSISADDSAKKLMVIADSTGNFSLSNLRGGHYVLLFSLIGYKDFSLKLFLIKDTSVAIQMQPNSGQLKDVAVQSAKPTIERKADRYILNVAGNIATQGKQTADILKYAPGISITNNVLSMFGKASLLVYINDFQIRLDSKNLLEYLNSLPPDDIQSIEIISMPPAQYDAAGNTGVVKIVMKKNINPGWKGYIKTDYTKNTYSGLNGSAGLDYIGKKLSVTATLFGSQYYGLDQNQYSSYYPSETVSTFNPKKGNRKDLQGSINANYKIDSNSSLNLVYQFEPSAEVGLKDLVNKTDYFNTNNLLDSSITSNGVAVYNFKHQNIDLFFKRNLKKEGSYFDVEAALLNYFSNPERTFSTLTVIEGDSSNFGAYKTRSVSRNITYTAQTDFVFPFKKWNLNFGGKTTFTKNTADYNFYNFANGAYIADETQS